MKIKRTETLFIILTGLVTMLICTKSSPLYPTNDWVDANCYMTVGRAMTEGKMPYRDLFEHKGPIIYILHAAGALISDSSFFGIFLIETAVCIWFLYLCFSLVMRFTGKRFLWPVPLFAMIIYSSQTFCHGDSAEEFCLPIILYSFILGLPTIESGTAMSDKSAFLLGVLSGIVLWMKFNLLGFYVGAFPVIAFLSRKNGAASIIRMSSIAVLGIAAVSLPVILYFTAENSLYSMTEVYFYNNIFVYGGEKTSLFKNLLNGFVFTLRFFPLGTLMIVSGTAAAIRSRKKKYAAYGIASLITAFFGTFAGHLSYRYYPLILAPFAVIFGTAAISFISRKIRLPERSITAAFNLILCTAGAFILSPNTYLMHFKKEQLPQYKFADIINKTEEPSLLNYGFLDGGFYLAADIIPEQRYFCCSNMKLDEMIKSQQQAANDGVPDFIVTRSLSGTHPDFPLYTCIAEESFQYCDQTFHYFLFRRN